MSNRPPRPGRERHVVRLVNEGKRDEAIAYMSLHGMIQDFRGAPDTKPVSVPEVRAAILATPPPAAYVYPDFKPQREPLPVGVKWARIFRELAHELQKIAVFEEDESVQVLLWMGLRQQQDAKTRGRLVGQVFPIERNPEPLQGGYRVWRR